MRSSTAACVVGLPLALCAQNPFCSPQGNTAIFSNYDGGVLTINVDQDIQDLHIGIVSYEFALISLTGPYVNNVTAVLYAGYNGTNDHCDAGALGLTTNIVGEPPGTEEGILLYPPAGWPNPNGNANIICCYTCDVSTQQGGCNTADQIAHYFLDQWNGVLLFHLTQYDCWQGVYNISDGGNCCVDPLATAIVEGSTSASAISATLNGDRLEVAGEGPFQVIDASGRPVLAMTSTSLGVGALGNGSYVVRSGSTNACVRFVIAR